ncbi:MAG TPA: metalloregulator ArsR/SmtB family transcription factor [Victivallales bacterium]|nr:metalloregulator ArsR/SmtB family transcription factor [Victivallales bacterium]
MCDSDKNIRLMDYTYLNRVADCLKLMAHPVRIRMVEILSNGLYPVNEIAKLCEIPPNQACEHLRLLKNHDLLDSERNGRIVYYKIKSQQLTDLLSCIANHCTLE